MSSLNTPALTRQAIIRLVKLESLYWGVQFVFDDGEIIWATQTFPTKAEAVEALQVWVAENGAQTATVH
jgi:uncharacterized protein YegP (UPF0339 family)